VNLAELVEEGIRAYTRGDRAEAERCWREVLASDPRHARARAYLVMLARLGAAPPTPAGPARAEPPPAVPAGAGDDADDVGPEELPLPWEDGPAVAPVPAGLPTAAPVAVPAPPPRAPSLQPGWGEQGRAGEPRRDVEAWMQRAREQFAIGDFSGSLETLGTVLGMDPGNVEANEYRRRNEATLLSMYESKLGRLDAAPRLAMRPEDVMWLNLDQHAGFLLAQMDGIVTYDDLFALSSLPRLDTARLLAGLVQDGVITS
jgi:hypothetical protein